MRMRDHTPCYWRIHPRPLMGIASIEPQAKKSKEEIKMQLFVDSGRLHMPKACMLSSRHNSRRPHVVEARGAAY